MKHIAITGGIGSGKSYVCRLLGQRGISVYDCDVAAKRLMRTSPQLRRQLISLIGPEAYLAVKGEQGEPVGYVLNKAAVAQFLLASEEHARAIDDIVHPAVAADFLKSGQQWLESAILFQSGFDLRIPLDTIIVVTAPEEVRISRVMQRDGITRAKACEWIARQWPQDAIRQRAHYEIINDGQQPLLPQIENIIQTCNRPF